MNGDPSEELEETVRKQGEKKQKDWYKILSDMFEFTWKMYRNHLHTYRIRYAQCGTRDIDIDIMKKII